MIGSRRVCVDVFWKIGNGLYVMKLDNRVLGWIIGCIFWFKFGVKG